MEPGAGSIAGLPSFPPILRLKPPFSFVQPSSSLTLHLYAKYFARPNTLLGTHEFRIPLEGLTGLFYWDLPLFNRLNITRADIACVLENDVGETARSMQPATLYIKVKITPPTLNNSPPTIPIEVDDPPTNKATFPGRIQSITPEHPLPPLLHQAVEDDNNKPQNREELSPATSKNLLLDLRPDDEAMERINRSNTCQGVVRRIKWVMDTLGPIAEVRVIPF